MAAPEDELVVVKLNLNDIKTAVTKDRVWLGFPHYVVLGWALLVSYTIYWEVDRLDEHLQAGEANMARLNETNTVMANAIRELQEHTQELRDDAIKTRMILELKFPRTAQQVEDAFEGEQP